MSRCFQEFRWCSTPNSQILTIIITIINILTVTHYYTSNQQKINTAEPFNIFYICPKASDTELSTIIKEELSQWKQRKWQRSLQWSQHYTVHLKIFPIKSLASRQKSCYCSCILFPWFVPSGTGFHWSQRTYPSTPSVIWWRVASLCCTVNICATTYRYCAVYLKISLHSRVVRSRPFGYYDTELCEIKADRHIFCSWMWTKLMHWFQSFWSTGYPYLLD